GTSWSYRVLRELSTPRRAPIDWWGNITFALALILVMTSVTYGIRPWGGHAVGWGSPRVLALLAVARGGLMFMLIIWLQGIWLPQHGYSFEETPLWAGIYMLPLTMGMLLAGPTSGFLSDRYGARPFATAGMLLTALGFGMLLMLPTNFSYLAFGAILFLIGASMG